MTHPLWPELGTDADHRDHRSTPHLVLPSVTDPRLVIPTRPERAVRQLLHALRPESSIRVRATTWGIRVAALAQARSVRLPTPTLFEAVAAALQRPLDDLVIGVHLGPPRANRKPVLAVTERRGHLVAFAKYGVDRLTDALVAHEAQALAELEEACLDQLVVPRLIASGDHDGHPFVLQAPVPSGRRGPAPSAVAAAQVQVARLGSDRIDPAAAVSAVRAEWRRRGSAADDPVTHECAELAAVWCDAATDLTWGSWHGDWRTTNMGGTDGRCSVWDWERFTAGVPQGYDALHLFLTSRQQSVHDLAALPVDVREHAPRLLRPFGVVDRRAADLVTTGYFLTLAGRYLDDAQARAGARLGDVGRWLLPHLRQTTPDRGITRGGNTR